MRHPILIAAALALGVGASVHPAAAQKPAGQKPGVAPRAAAPPHGVPAKAAPAPATAQVLDPLSLDVLGARASLDARTRARVAPHVTGMNAELKEMRKLTTAAPRNAPKAEQDKLHADLAGHYAAFQRHWDEADALLTPGQKTAFDVAVREQMGGRRVGNPHTNLPAYHPKLNAKGGKAEK